MGDELVKVLKDYANNEIVNKSLSTGLENLSTTLTAIEEYRNCEVQRLEAKVNVNFFAHTRKSTRIQDEAVLYA